MKYKIDASRFSDRCRIIAFCFASFLKIIIILQFVFGFLETHIYFYTYRKLNLNENIFPTASSYVGR